MALAPRDGWPLFPGQSFPAGINYPWNNYGWDFGLSKWDLAAGGDGKKGVSLPANSTKTLSQLGYTTSQMPSIRGSMAKKMT